MTLATLIGLSGQSLLVAALVLKLLLLLKVPGKTAAIMSALIFIITFIPLEGYSINLYLRGLFNDLSITTLCLLMLFLYQAFLYQPLSQSVYSRTVYIPVAVSGAVLYPLALGYGPVDPYAWGYLNQSHGLTAPLLFIAVLLLLASYAFIKQYTLLLICILLSVTAYQLNILESRNIWDYLLDPLLWIYALIQLPFMVFARKY